MPNSKGKTTYHLVTDTDYYHKFNERYPKLLKVFLTRSIKLAVEDKNFFDKVFFSDIKIKEVL